MFMNLYIRWPVSKVEPSGLHFPTVTSPSCASMLLSILVILLIKCNLPISKQKTKNTSMKIRYTLNTFYSNDDVPFDEVISICSIPAVLFVNLWVPGNMCKSIGYDLSGRSHNFMFSFVAWLHLDTDKSLLNYHTNNLTDI